MRANYLFRKAFNLFNSFLLFLFLMVDFIIDQPLLESLINKVFIVSLIIETTIILLDQKKIQQGEELLLPNIMMQFKSRFRYLFIFLAVAALIYHTWNGTFSTDWISASLDILLPIYFILFLPELMSIKVNKHFIQLTGLFNSTIKIKNIESIYFTNGKLIIETNKKKHHINGQKGESILLLDEFFHKNKINHIKTKY